MNLNPLSGIIETVGNVIGDLHTSDKERGELFIENRKLDIEEQKVGQSIDLANIKVNEQDSKGESWVQRNWRPGFGWVAVAGFAYQFVLYPLLLWIWALLGAFGVLPAGLTPPPPLDVEPLWVLASALLGVASLRTVDKKFKR